LCFAFYSSGYPRALHSFPTRRSSDLESLSVRSSCSLLLPTLHPRQGRFCILRCQMALCLTLHALLLSTPPHHHKIQGSRCDCFRDRKSTRLNSSHVKISYAVFCLKKK